MANRELRILSAVILLRLGITQVEFEFYWNTFVQGWHRYWKKKNTGNPFDGWFAANNRAGEPIPLDEYKIFHHLAGDYWTAKRPPGITDFFAIDVDVHDFGGLDERCHALIRTIGPGLVIRSSDSGGVHIYWGLPYKMSSKELGTLLEKILALAGLDIQLGFIETFPGSVPHLRLPLGRGSVILSPTTLRPLNLSLRHSIRYIMRQRSSFTVDLKARYKFLLVHGQALRRANGEELASFRQSKRTTVFEIPDLCGDADSTGPANVDSNDVSNAHQEGDLDRLLEGLNVPQATMSDSPLQRSTTLPGAPIADSRGGVTARPIPEYSTRNKLLLKAVQERILKYGDSPEAAITNIKAWLWRTDLEHRSRDLESRPVAVEQQVRAAVKNFIGKVGDKRRQLARAPLSLQDLQAIVDILKRTQGKRPFGRKEFYLLRFLFHLTGMYKANATKELPLPRNLIKTMDGVSIHSASETINICLNTGIITLTKEEDYKEGRCRTFRLNHSFCEGPKVTTLTEGLLRLYDKAALRKLFTRGIYDLVVGSQDTCKK
jgi:hypothetical protein